MDSSAKKLLKSQVNKYCGDFGLPDILFDSFTRQYGFKIKISASDVVYGLIALLEAPINIDSSTNQFTLSNSSHRNFYAAFDALDSYESLLIFQKQCGLVEDRHPVGH